MFNSGSAALGNISLFGGSAQPSTSVSTPFSSSAVAGDKPPSTTTATIFQLLLIGTGTIVRFEPTLDTDQARRKGLVTQIRTKLMNLCAMPAYGTKSMEELRLEDYTHNRKLPFTTLFPATSSLFGGFMTMAPATAAKSAFGGFTAVTAAPATTSSFSGFTTLATAPATTSLFGSVPTTTTVQTAPSLFGGVPITTTAQTVSSLFGSVPTTTVARTVSSPFGGVPTTTTAPTVSSSFGSVTTTKAVPTATFSFGNFTAMPVAPATTPSFGGVTSTKAVPAATSPFGGFTASIATSAANPFSVSEDAAMRPMPVARRRVSRAIPPSSQDSKTGQNLCLTQHAVIAATSPGVVTTSTPILLGSLLGNQPSVSIAPVLADFTGLSVGTRTETVEINVGAVNSEYAGGYYCNDTQQINILLVGRTQTGKSTIIEALKNPEYQQSNTGFSTTSNPECYRTILFDKQSKQAFQLNMIDTPGLNEVSRDSGTSRSNSELLDLVRTCIKNTVTTLNVICFVSQAGRTHQFDVDTFAPLIDFLGPDWSDNSMIILTHSDGFDTGKLLQFEKDIERNEKSTAIHQYCKLGVFCHGILNHDELSTYAHDPKLQNMIKASKMKHLTTLRTKLIQMFVTMASKPRRITQLQEIASATTAERQGAVDGAMKDNPQSEPI